MNFNDWVRKHPNVEATALAKTAIQKVPKLLIPVIAQEIEHVRRMGEREIEHKTLRPFLQKVKASNGTHAITGKAPAKLSISPAILQAMKNRIRIGDGKKVLFGEMTIEQHLKRIAFLTTQRNGINNTINLHEEAISILQKRKKKCMNDVVASIPA